MTVEPLELAVDLEHGGRWTSLTFGGREWLWTNPDPVTASRRLTVRPGDAFVDAGGVEECFPTVRGAPDHGDVWSRRWDGTTEDAAVSIPGTARLRRSIRSAGSSITVNYEVTGEPGDQFLHAVHALLDVSPSATLVVPEADSMTVLDVDDPVRPWPSGLDRLGPDDGTAICSLIPGCHEATVVDRDQALRFAWRSTADPDLCSLLLWRNLGGWPAHGPYRSIGIEPMIGRTAELAGADSADCGRLGPTGRYQWTLIISAYWR